MRLLISLALTFCFMQVVACQNKSSNSTIPVSDSFIYFQQYQEAQRFYEARDFAKAIPLYERLTAKNPQDGENWLRLANSRYYAREYRAAIEAYQKANELGFGFLQNNYYSIAACYALLGDKDNATLWLEKALNEQRIENRSYLLEDEDFKSLRSDPRFRQLAGLLPERKFSREEGWRYDLDFLMSEVRRLNAVYSARPLPANIQQAAENLRARIPNLSDAQVYVEMQRLLAMLGHGHNGFWAWIPNERIKLTQLPLTLYFFPEGLYVIDAEGSYKHLIGSRIVKFGNKSTDEVVQAIRTVVDRENEMEILWRGPEYIRMPQVLHALGLTDSPDKITLTLENRTGETITEETIPVAIKRRRKLFPSQIGNVSQPPLYLSNVEDSYWFKHLPEDKTLYLQFNQVADKRDESLSQFALRLRRFLNENEVDNLIIDLRHNNGGNTYLYPELLKTIIAFDAREGKKLYALIGRNTYSAAQNFAVDLERMTNAVFVGEPSGGKPNTHGDESHVILPYSGLHAGLSAVYWQLSSPRDSRLWIAPTIPVSLTAEDYFANRDPVMEIITKLINQ
jgi:hypothetical protein